MTSSPLLASRLDLKAFVKLSDSKKLMEGQRISEPVRRLDMSAAQIGSVATKLRLTKLPKKSLGGSPTRNQSINPRIAIEIGQNMKTSLVIKKLDLKSQKYETQPIERLNRNGSDSTKCEPTTIWKTPSIKFNKALPLRVTKPEFIKTKGIDFPSPPILPPIDVDSATESDERYSMSPKVSPDNASRQHPYNQSLKQLLNMDLQRDEKVMLPFELNLSENQKASSPNRFVFRPGAFVFPEASHTTSPKRCVSVTSTRSILVRKDKSSRDISRLNDSCSPKKKVAFAKNKMVLLFTKDT